MKVYSHDSEFGQGVIFFRNKDDCLRSQREEFPEMQDRSPIACYTIGTITKDTIVACLNGEGFAQIVTYEGE